MRAIQPLGTAFDIVDSSWSDIPMGVPSPTRHATRGGFLGHMGSQARPIASAALRSLVLVAIAMLLILALLPAALSAAGT